MALEAKLTIDTSGYNIRGEKVHVSGQTLLQDAGRVIPLAFLTVMAQQASSLKWVPLTDVDPDEISASMACGAVGATAAEFAAAGSSSFGLGVDGETAFQVVTDLSGLDSPADTPGYMTAGAIGGTLPEFQAVADAQFGIGIDGNAAIQVGGMDFSGLDTDEDTPGSYLCGANGAIIAAGWDAIADGAGTFPINGADVVLAAMDFTDCLTFWDVAATINHHAAGRFTCTYDGNADVFQIISPTTGETSTVLALSAGVAGTDITAAGYLNGTVAGAATAGTGGEGTAQTIPDIINAAALGRFFCYLNGDAFVFVSPTAGEVSAVSDLTAGTAGTDISGAGFLNGLAGTNVAGTGGEGLFQSVVDIINAELAGRAECSFDGDKFIFWSPTKGLPKSAITVLTAGTTGTDISGAAYLNGLTGTGVLSLATGGDGENLPAGLFWSDAVTAAALIAGDVTSQNILVGKTFEIDEDTIVLENSLDLDDIITATGKTIRVTLFGQGIYAKSADYFQNIQPIA